MLVSFLPPVHKDIPHEPGQFMLLRKPAGPVVQDARKRVEAEGRRSVRDLGAEIVKELFSGKGDDDKAVKRIKRLEEESYYDPSNFDRPTMLAAGIREWSYVDLDGKPIPVTEEAIAELDDQTSEWAHRELVAMIRPVAGADKSPAQPSVPGDAGDGAQPH